MKKLLTIALIVVSPTLFAKDFNPDLLVGTWQCTTTYEYRKNNIKGTEIDTIKFLKNGKYHSKTIIDEVENGQKNITTLDALGEWKIVDDTLSYNIGDVFNYHASNQELEDYNQTEWLLKNFDSFIDNIDNKILELSADKLILTLTDKDKQELNAELMQNCHRNKD